VDKQVQKIFKITKLCNSVVAVDGSLLPFTHETGSERHYIVALSGKILYGRDTQTYPNTAGTHHLDNEELMVPETKPAH